MTRLLHLVPNKELSLFVRDILAINEQIFQIQRDKIKLQQRLADLEQERKVNEKDRNLLIEIDNIINLLEEFEIRHSTKSDELKRLEHELSNLEMIEKGKMEYDKTASSTFQRKRDKADQIEYTKEKVASNLKNEFDNYDRKSRTNKEETGKGNFNRQKILEIQDYSASGYDRFPSSENGFKRSKVNN